MTLQSGDVDEFGHPRLGGIGTRLQQEIATRTGFEARVTVLGHLLRGGTPTAFDRILATQFGIAAIDAVNDRDFAKMVALHGTDIVRVPIGDGVGESKTVDGGLFEAAVVFFA
jgi:6-phosphofructokinase 1